MPMARVSPTELAFAHAVQHLAYAYVTRGIQSTCRCVGAGFPGLGGTPGDRSMSFRPCILQYIIHFPGSRRNSRGPLDVVQTVYFTIYYQLSRVSEKLETRTPKWAPRGLGHQNRSMTTRNVRAEYAELTRLQSLSPK